MNNQEFKVRDLRKKEQFIIDDAYLNGYGKVFGPIGTAVYLSLSRRADKRQSCWPSETTIAKDHNISDRTVRKYIKAFKQFNLIRVERERSESGKWLHNVYYLLDKSEWKKPEEIASAGYWRKTKTLPEENNNTNQRKQVPTKDAQEKDAHKKDYNPDKKSFKMNQVTSVNEFEPQNSDEARCLEIAQWLGESNMNFILFQRMRYGLPAIERAYGIVKEDDIKKHLKNRASYFNAVIGKIVSVGGR